MTNSARTMVKLYVSPPSESLSLWIDRVNQLGKTNLRLKYMEDVTFLSARLGKTSLQLKFIE